jgi:hypothetical protein
MDATRFPVFSFFIGLSVRAVQRVVLVVVFFHVNSGCAVRLGSFFATDAGSASGVGLMWGANPSRMQMLLESFQHPRLFKDRSIQSAIVAPTPILELM